MSDYFISHASQQYKGDSPDDPDSLLEQAYESRQGSDFDPHDGELPTDEERAAWLAELAGDGGET